MHPALSSCMLDLHSNLEAANLPSSSIYLLLNVLMRRIIFCSTQFVCVFIVKF